MKLNRQALWHAYLWFGAAAIGAIAVGYARLVSFVQNSFFAQFALHPYYVSLSTPILFFIATYLVAKFAPQAKGSGIPQVIEAIEICRKPNGTGHSSELISIKTALVKVLSSTIGILGGASLGREGPTVQIASSTFAWLGRKLRDRLPEMDFTSFLVAGASAGVAAAFNTPLAGVTFALEEIAEHAFASLKQTILLTIVIAGISAQAIAGDYLYFGRPQIPRLTGVVLLQAPVIGLCCGLLGAMFARMISSLRFKHYPWHWRALTCGTICAAIGILVHGESAGSGYEITRNFMDGDTTNFSSFFFIEKMATTLASYISGMAGGLFSPCLSIGAGVGITIGKLISFGSLRAAALIGMVGFFSGVVQAPLTAVVIVMEMTDKHSLIIPFMISAFIAQYVARQWMPVPLYRHLAQRSAETQAL